MSDLQIIEPHPLSIQSALIHRHWDDSKNEEEEIEILSLLLQPGNSEPLKVNAVNHCGRSPLSFAVRGDSGYAFPLANFSISNGADATLLNNKGWNALMYSCDRNGFS